MLTTTLVEDESCLSTLILRPCKDKKSKYRIPKKKTMASRKDQPQLSDDSQAGSSARVKKFHSKSRRGCLTCRQRRVKCDERRTPNCARCDKGGYICEWAETRLGRSRASEDRLSSTPTRSASVATVRSEDDNLLHRFFSEGIVGNVATLFTDMASSFIGDTSKAQDMSHQISSFYYQFVYEASQSHRIIRKTLSALCGLYERAPATSRTSSPRNPEPISRYGEAVTDLRTSSRGLSPDVVLIASILFANCEYLMGDLCSAVRHLRAGARILVEHHDSAGEQLSSALRDALSTIFAAFEHDSVDLESATPGSDYLDTIGEHQFDNLNQANDQLLQIYAHTFALQKMSQSHSNHISLAVNDFKRWSNSWRSRIADLGHSLGTEQLPWLHLLHGQHIALNTVIDTMSRTNEATARDHQLDDLILQMSDFLEASAGSLQDKEVMDRPYHENVGLILPLFLVTLRCADPQTCEAALALLGRLCVVEGALNSCCAHAVAQSAIHARHAARMGGRSTTYTSENVLPVAEIKKVALCEPGAQLDVTFTFPRNSASGQMESNAIVSRFCLPSIRAAENLCGTLEAGGYQGPVATRTLEGCSCNQSP